MEIQDISFHRVSVPRIYNTKVAPMGGYEGGKAGSDYVLIEAMAGGAVGLGEISDIESDWGDLDWDSISGAISEAMVGEDPRDRVRLVDRVIDVLPGDLHRELRMAVRAAVECVLMDVVARYYGVPLVEMLGGLKRPSVRISWVAFIGNEDGIEQEIREKAEAGFSAFKLKVGADHTSDLERISLTREIIGRDSHLRVDASGEWTSEEAIEKLVEMRSRGVDAVETPIQAVARTVVKNSPEQVNENADEIAAELAKVRKAVDVRVIEHVSDFDDAFSLALANHRSVDVFNVLPGQAGGLSRAQKLIHLAELSGIDVLLGSTVELSPGTAAALSLGLASSGVTEACDLVGPGLLVSDVCEDPLTYSDGHLVAQTSSGLGVDLSPDKLTELKSN